MKSLFASFAAVAAVAAAAATAAEPPARIFDIVPPEGRRVEWVDDLTVLRQPGTKFGAVLTFMPVWSTTGLIRLAKERQISAPPGLVAPSRGASAVSGPPTTPAG